MSSERCIQASRGENCFVLVFRGIALGNTDTEASRKHNLKNPDFSTIFLALHCFTCHAVARGLRIVSEDPIKLFSKRSERYPGPDKPTLLTAAPAPHRTQLLPS